MEYVGCVCRFGMPRFGWVCVEAGGQHWDAFPNHSPWDPLRQSFSLNLVLDGCLGLLASELRASIHVCPPGRHTLLGLLLCRCWGSKLRASCLHRNHFTHWAAFQRFNGILNGLFQSPFVLWNQNKCFSISVVISWLQIYHLIYLIILQFFSPWLIKQKSHVSILDDNIQQRICLG